MIYEFLIIFSFVLYKCDIFCWKFVSIFDHFDTNITDVFYIIDSTVMSSLVRDATFLQHVHHPIIFVSGIIKGRKDFLYIDVRIEILRKLNILTFCLFFQTCWKIPVPTCHKSKVIVILDILKRFYPFVKLLQNFLDFGFPWNHLLSDSYQFCAEFR